MNYPDSVQFLYALGNEIQTAKLGLERIEAVLQELGNPQDACRFIHVAGTNGKGSTCAMIESGLRAAGVRTGLFTSPHLNEPTERIRIDGVPVSADRFAAAFDHVHAAVERLLARGSIDLHTTYFETVTAMAMTIFAEERVDKVVLEVGLGGRLDATNVVSPELCVVTAVDYDHEAWLGKSLDSIAAEKAGILKRGVPAVFARQRPEAAVVLERRAAELEVPVTRTSEWQVTDLALDARSSHFHLQAETPTQPGGQALTQPDNRASTQPANPALTSLGSTSFSLCPVGQAILSPALDPRPRNLALHCPLAGEHQVENAIAAATALACLAVPAAAIESGIAATRWPGRLERISQHPEIIVDGAHNPAGARALAAYITRFYANRPVRLIYGGMRDKSVAEIGGILFPLAQQVIVTAPRQSRALTPESVRDLVSHPDLRTAPTLEAALDLARAPLPGADPADDVIIFITGSLFLVAEARAMIGATC